MIFFDQKNNESDAAYGERLVSYKLLIRYAIMRARHGDAVSDIKLGAFITGATLSVGLPFTSFLMASSAVKAWRSSNDSEWLDQATDWFYKVLTENQWGKLNVTSVLQCDDKPLTRDWLTDEGVKRVFFRTCESIFDPDMRECYIQKLGSGTHPVTIYMQQYSEKPSSRKIRTSELIQMWNSENKIKMQNIPANNVDETEGVELRPVKRLR